ncbi:MAG: bacillithiol biosynthesis cysteine-adding enzyme BshC [Bacteroidota bacterium]|jgi:bacillithiol biosynthesis cysteine-adding enzyme BshC|nr:bacillithiol biosynthesis cysteine-adding enzyme BshC [Bacteroidota bacterium]
MLFTRQGFSFNETALFSPLFLDYLNACANARDFYEMHISGKDFERFLKQTPFDLINREALVNCLEKQSAMVSNTSKLSLYNISLLKDTNTYTVTTGHQLCLFTGPLYFIYKIVSTINLCETLKFKFPENNFVPVYWMASEDHDFEEINHIHVFGKKLEWQTDQKGAVGEMQTESLDSFLEDFRKVLGSSENANALISLFEKAYLHHANLTDATRFLVNELFGEYGLVTLDANDKELKFLFRDEFKKDVFEHIPYNMVTSTIEQMKKQYPIQVTPREINVFYKENGIRERIEKSAEGYRVVNTDIEFSVEELTSLIENEPQKLSPNVVLRPVYQQKILPNIAYVGGPGELAYWLEYKTMFDEMKVPMPILMPRNFALVLDKASQSRLQKLNLNTSDIFREGEELVKQFIKDEHNDLNLDNFKQRIGDLYSDIAESVKTIDKTLVGSAEAEKQKAIKGIITLELKIQKALKQKSETDVNQIWSLKEKLFPNNIPQERYENFSTYYLKHGKDFIADLKEQLTYNLETQEYLVLKEN